MTKAQICSILTTRGPAEAWPATMAALSFSR
jgi:hypothetical protein